MPKYKLTLELNSFRGGWSESIYLDQPTPINVLTTTRPVILARMQCSPPSVSLVGIRIAQYPDPPALLPTPRIGTFVDGNLQGLMILPPEEPDLLQNKAVLTAYSAFVARRKIWIGGMADAQTVFTNPTGTSIPGPALGGALTAYGAALVAAGCQIRSFIPATVPANSWQTVVSVVGTGLAGTELTFNYTGTQLLVIGDYVTFGRVNQKLFPKLTGNWLVTRVTVGSFTIQYYNNYGTGPVLLVGGLRVRRVGVVYNTISSTLFDSFRAHKVGKSLGESRGRARAVSFRR